MTAHPLDRSVLRRGTGSVKWDHSEEGGGFPPVDDPDIIPMWVADMDFACPEAVTRAISERMRNPIFGYSLESPGFASAFADWTDRRHGWRPDPGWVEPSEGVVPDLQHLVRGLLRAGEGVIVHPPVYYPFFAAVRHGGAKLVPCPLRTVPGPGNPWRLDLEAFARLAAEPTNRMTFLCSPHNPVGRVWTPSELADFARIARDNDVIVVADEIHADLMLDGARFTPWLSLDESDRARSIVVTSPCKTFNIAGLKISCLVIPDEGIRDTFRRTRMRAGAYGVNPLSVAAAEAAWREGDGWLDEVLGYLTESASEVRRFFEDRPGLGVSMTLIEATYLPWLDFRAARGPDPEVAAFLLRKARVRLKEGALFGQEGQGFARMNIACPRPLLREALRRIADALEPTDPA